MDEKTFKTRTKKLAVAIIHQTENLPRSLAADVLANSWSAQEHRLAQTIELHAAQNQ